MSKLPLVNFIVLLDSKYNNERSQRNFKENLRVYGVTSSNYIKSLDNPELSSWSVFSNIDEFLAYQQKTGFLDGLYVFILHNYSNSLKYLNQLSTDIQYELSSKLKKDFKLMQSFVYERKTNYSIWADIQKFCIAMGGLIPVPEKPKFIPRPEVPKVQEIKEEIKPAKDYPIPATKKEIEQVLKGNSERKRKFFENVPESLESCEPLAISKNIQLFIHYMNSGHVRQTDPKIIQRVNNYLKSNKYGIYKMPYGLSYTAKRSGKLTVKYVKPMDMYYALFDPESNFHKHLDEEEESIKKTNITPEEPPMGQSLTDKTEVDEAPPVLSLKQDQVEDSQIIPLPVDLNIFDLLMVKNLYKDVLGKELDIKPILLDIVKDVEIKVRENLKDLSKSGSSVDMLTHIEYLTRIQYYKDKVDQIQ